MTKRVPEVKTKKGDPVGTEPELGVKGTGLGGKGEISLLTTDQKGIIEKGTSFDPESSSDKQHGFWYGKSQFLTKCTKQQQLAVVGVQKVGRGTELCGHSYTDRLERSRAECTEMQLLARPAQQTENHPN